MTTTTDNVPTIQQAVRALARVCDGAIMDDGHGYNGRDARFGHALAAIPHDDWSPKQLAAAYDMVRLYRVQLLRYGIDYSQIRKPEEESALQRSRWLARRAAAGKPVRKVVQDPKYAKLLLLQFPYERELVAALKAAGLKAFKDEATQQWNWPVYEDRLHAVVPILRQWNFEGLPAEAAAKGEKQAANLTTSKAEASALVVNLPGKPAGTVRPYQAVAVEYVQRNERAIIADQMGLGKTIEALACFEHLNAYPALVVCPPSLTHNWKAEVQRWLPHRTVNVLETGKSRVPLVEITIVSDALVKATSEKVSEGGKQRTVYTPSGLAAEIKKTLPLAAIAVDEFHRAKNKDAQRSKGIAALAQGVRYRIGLTGTPLKNRPNELIHQLDVIGRLEDFGGFWGFARRYCAAHREAIPGGKLVWNLDGSSNLTELHERLRTTCFLRRTKDVVLKELPPKQFSRVVLPIDNRAEYEAAEDEFLAWLAETEGDEAAERAARAEQLVRVGKLQQLAVKGKLKAIEGWVEGFLEAGEKLVLFAHHIAAQEAIYQAFADQGAQAIRGGAPREEVEEAKRQFNAGPAPIIVCSLLAGGLGHTLHADGKCSNLANAQFGWTPADMEQAEDRIHRFGQTAESVNIWNLVAEGTIDEDMEALLEQKRRVCDTVTDGAVRERLKAGSIADELLARFRAKATKRRK